MSAIRITPFCAKLSPFQRPPGGLRAVKASVAAHWAALDDHFRYHATLVDRFSTPMPTQLLACG